MADAKLLSIVVPAYNEAAGIQHFYQSLTAQLEMLHGYRFELIFVDDGSADHTAQTIQQLATHDDRVRLQCLSRNFGKEAATTAGIQIAQGDAIMTIDADGQHPVELIGSFLDKWQQGAKVVIGVREANEREGVTKRVGSRWFYRIFNKVAGIKVIPGSTDYRLIDKVVQQEFNRLHEHNRITRVLIDWLGYDRQFITFRAHARHHGEASYSTKKLVQLAIDSVVAHSSSPLYYAAFLGIFILPLSILLGVIMLLDSIFGDPFSWHITGSAYLVVLMLGLVGVLLISQGIIGLYLSQIQTETKNRPLFIVDESRSVLHESAPKS